ncbi:hypothetical protein [Moorena producens]
MQRGLGGSPHERLHQDNVLTFMDSAIFLSWRCVSQVMNRSRVSILPARK